MTIKGKNIKYTWAEYAVGDYPRDANGNTYLREIHLEIEGVDLPPIVLTNDPDYHNGRCDLFYVVKDDFTKNVFFKNSKKLENAKGEVIKTLIKLGNKLSKLDGVN